METWTLPSLFFYLISSSHKFVTFSSKTGKVTKKCYFLQVSKYSPLCLILLNMCWMNFQNIWKLLLLHKKTFGDKGKSHNWQSYVKKCMVFFKFYDKYQKILQKSHIYIIIQKKYFQQITPKPTNQTLNINLTMHFQIFHFSTGHIIWHCQHKPIWILSHCNCIGLVRVHSLNVPLTLTLVVDSKAVGHRTLSGWKRFSS